MRFIPLSYSCYREKTLGIFLNFKDWKVSKHFRFGWSPPKFELLTRSGISVVGWSGNLWSRVMRSIQQTWIGGFLIFDLNKEQVLERPQRTWRRPSYRYLISVTNPTKVTPSMVSEINLRNSLILGKTTPKLKFISDKSCTIMRNKRYG